MISVPTNTASKSSATPVVGPQIDDSYLMMAAAQMHKEGRLVLGDDPYIPSSTKDGKDANPPSAPPEEYYPSNGQRNAPAMMAKR